MSDKKVILPAGAYSVRDSVSGVISTVNVPNLTAGAIDQVAPTPGTILTVSGSNATAQAPSVWQQSADAPVSWSDIVGQTGTTLDTTGFTAGTRIRYGVDGLSQGLVYTADVQIAAVAELLTAGTMGLWATVVDSLIATSPALDIGAPAPNRRVYAVFGSKLTAQFDPASVTIGGVAAVRENTRTTQENSAVYVYSAIVPTGTTAVVVADWTGTGATVDAAATGVCQVFYGYGIETHATINAFAISTALAANIDVVNGGSVILIGGVRDGSPNTGDYTLSPGTMTKTGFIKTTFPAFISGLEQGLSAQTGRTYSVTIPIARQQNMVLVSVRKVA